MTKTCKKSLLVLLMVLTVVACFALAACGEDAPANTPALSVTYTVTVKTDETTPAQGVRVAIKKGGATFESKTTDANGKVEFSLVADSYEAVLSNLPEHYAVAEDASLTLTEQNPDLTVTLVRAFAYEVKLVNPDGTPFYAEGVQVGICTLAGNCLEPVMLEEGGVAIIEADKSDYHVQIIGLGSYVYECDSDGYYTGKNFSATETEMTITVYPLSKYDLSSDGMSASDKADFAEGFTSYTSTAQERTAHSISEKIAANGIAYVAVTPTISGKYPLYAQNNAIYELGNSFTTELPPNPMMNTVNGQELILQKGKTTYLAVKNNSEEEATVKAVVASPYSSYIEHTGVGGTVELTVGKVNTNAVIAFKPTSGGTYTVTAQGDVLAYVTGDTSAIPEIIDTENVPSDGDFEKGSSVSLNIDSKSVASDGKLYFAVTVKADSYPVQVSLEIKKTADNADTYTYAEVKETLTQYTKPENKELYGVPMDGSTQLVYNESDKFYHLGTVDGAVVVVLITENLDTNRFAEGAALAYMEMIDSRLATYVINEAEDGATSRKDVDYTKFLRGFTPEEYGFSGRNLVIPNEDDIITETYYAKYVNEDGVYPLTEELKEFLEKFYEANANSFWFSIPEDAAQGCEWMFPLYYYDDIIEADAIVGEYKFVSGVIGGEEIIAGNNGYTEDAYMLVVNKNGTFAIYGNSRFGTSQIVNGTWSKSGDDYSFISIKGTTDDAWNLVDLVYAVTFDSATRTISLVGTGDYADYADYPSWTFKGAVESAD